MAGGIFDTHAHYDDTSFDGDREQLLETLPFKGVTGVINCGTNVKSSREAIALAEKYPYIYAACGIHPSDAGAIESGDFAVLADLYKHEKCVAVGEIGLDYHYDDTPRELQKEIFERQVKNAVFVGLPVIIHDREAHSDTLEIVKKYRPRGVMHCFSGSPEFAREVLDAGLYIGLGGAVTFKNAKKPLEVAKMVPIDRLLLETDCPYMTPEPYRGRRNESDYISFVAETIAEARGISPEVVLTVSAQNAKDLFEIH